MDNKLSIHFGEDQIYSLFKGERFKREINISFLAHTIKQHKTVEYLGYQLGSKLSEKRMASKVLKKVHAKLKFLYRQSRFLTPAYKRPLCANSTTF